MKRGSLHTRSFRRVHFSVFRYGWSKNGFTGSKSFRSFRETGPRRRMWVEFVVRSLLCSETGFSPGTPVIPSPQKPTFLNSTLLWTPASGDCANTPCVWYKIHIYILLLQCFSLNLFPTQILQEVENIYRLAFPFFPSCSTFTLFLVHSVGLLVNAYGPLLAHSCPLCRLACRVACCFHNMNVFRNRVVNPMSNPQPWGSVGLRLEFSFS